MKLGYETKEHWHMVQVTAAPIILSETGVLPRKLHKNLNLLDLKQGISINIRRAAVLGT
jgi:hypothetical protein